MSIVDLNILNKKFAIADHVRFETGPGNLIVANISNIHATATIALLGAHVLSYQPHGQDPVLWMSSYSNFEDGKPIRGGIPICWPWFAEHPSDDGKPLHGFARTRLWKVIGTDIVDNNKTRLQFQLSDDNSTRVLWPYAFELQLIVTVGPQLCVELIHHNTDANAVTCTHVFHSYFVVKNVANVIIRGLENQPYLDKVDGMQRKIQKGPTRIGNEEVAHIFIDTDTPCVIDDPGMGRTIHVAKRGSKTTVVWNPGIKKAESMEDFGGCEYPEMVCIEVGNVADDAITILPSGKHPLQTIISVGNS